MEFTKKETYLLGKMMDFYWKQYNADHEDNSEDWRTTFNIVKKLTKSKK
jgi:hypothetical protein